MKEMNELVELAEKADAVANLMDDVNPHTILAIADAFRALEQRAEAAEAKLAELESAIHKFGRKQGVSAMQSAELVIATLSERPAPGVSLAELVPNCLVDALCNLDLPGVSIGDKAIIGKAIEVLRNIEEANK